MSEVFTRVTTEFERTQLTLLQCATMLFVPANLLAHSYNRCSRVNYLFPTSLDSESLHYAA
jgi:hypothetical protein